MNILDQIVAAKKEEVALKKGMKSIQLLESSHFFESSPVSLKKYILRKDKAGVIAEFKRRSPSKPAINLYANIESTSIGYMQAGASALSILTDGKFFGAKEDDLSTARRYNFCPILRKDFIIDEYQIIEAKSMGADAILLIGEILEKQELKQLAAFAKNLQLEVLMEIHDQSQLDKINQFVDLIGVNNRDLNTFNTTIQTSLDLFPQLPAELVKISESGLHDVQSLLELSSCGYDGFLIGEKFMSSPNPVKACQKMIKEYQDLKTKSL